MKVIDSEARFRAEFDWENAPRVPLRSDLALAYERGLNFWMEEHYRQRKAEMKPWRSDLAELPDNKQDWEKLRPQLMQQFLDCAYGVMPPAPDKLEVKLLAENDQALHGMALRREYRVYCIMNNGRSFNFDLLLYLPKSAAKPPPVFLQLNFQGNQAYGPDMDIRPTRAAAQNELEWHKTIVNPQNRGLDPDRMSYVESIKRGYAVATACYGEIFPDNLDGFRQSIFTLFFDDLRPDHEVSLKELKEGHRRNFGAYNAWAWGYMRIADALEKIALTNPAHLACVGHSRLGVASMLAGIYDERFKLVCVNNGGLGLGQRIWFCKPCWFSDSLAAYVLGPETRLPFDLHQMLACIAPRALYVTSSSLDYGSNPAHTFQCTLEASKVWALYGDQPLKLKQLPEENKPVGERVRYHIKTGRHSIGAYDWQQFHALAEQEFK